MGALDSDLLRNMRAGAAKGRPYFVGAKTAAYTVSPVDCWGGVITNEGASGSVTLSLPPAEVGMRLHVEAFAAQEIILDPNGSEIVNALGAAAGDYVSNTTTPAIGDRITLICVEAGEWMIEDSAGDWDDQA